MFTGISKQHPLVVIVVLILVLAGMFGGVIFASAAAIFMALEGVLTGGGGLEDVPYLLGDFVFPLPKGMDYSYVDSWGAPREFGGERRHLGTDIMARAGTPVLSVTRGIVERKGWDLLGGWRIGIRGDDGNYYYYAHNQSYAPGIEVGNRVRSGQVIAFVGASGYGDQGTTGKFPPHLHFGVYNRRDNPINPYPYLRKWEDLPVMQPQVINHEIKQPQIMQPQVMKC